MSNSFQPEWTSEHVIRSYDVDPQMKACIASLCRFMQEIAYQHAEHLELGHSHLSAKKQGWVLARQRIEISTLPEWGDQITLRTWPSNRDRLFFYRDFEMTDAEGHLILQASTAWFMIDLEKRERISPAWFRGADFPIGPKLFSEKPGRLRSGGCSGGALIPVNYGDLDMNGHVNNIRYIEWVMNNMPLEFHQGHSLKSLEVNYLAEAVYGHSVSVCRHEVSPLVYDHGVLAAGTELFRARSIWKSDDG